MPASKFDKCPVTEYRSFHQADGTGHCKLCGEDLYNARGGRRKTVKKSRGKKTRGKKSRSSRR